MYDTHYVEAAVVRKRLLAWIATYESGHDSPNPGLRLRACRHPLTGERYDIDDEVGVPVEEPAIPTARQLLLERTVAAGWPVSERTLCRILAGELRWLTFNVADALACAMRMPFVFARGEWPVVSAKVVCRKAVA